MPGGTSGQMPPHLKRAADLLRDGTPRDEELAGLSRAESATLELLLRLRRDTPSVGLAKRLTASAQAALAAALGGDKKLIITPR